MIIRVETEKCTACGACLDVCPMGCIKIKDGAAMVVASACRGCQVCQAACPTGALVEDSSVARPRRSGLGRGGRPW